jgi:hypothetical protein
MCRGDEAILPKLLLEDFVCKFCSLPKKAVFAEFYLFWMFKDKWEDGLEGKLVKNQMRCKG